MTCIYICILYYIFFFIFCAEECPDESMQLLLPGDEDEFFSVITPSGPIDDLVDAVIPLDRGDTIVIEKIPAGLPFDVLELSFVSTGRTNVEIEYFATTVDTNVSKHHTAL